MDKNLNIDIFFNNYKNVYYQLKDWKECLQDIYYIYDGNRMFISNYAFNCIQLNYKTLKYITLQNWKNLINTHIFCTNDLEGWFGTSKTNRLMSRHNCISYTKAFENIRNNYLIKHNVKTLHNNQKRTVIDEESNNLLNCNEFLNIIKESQNLNNLTDTVETEYTLELENKINLLINKYKIAKTLSLKENYHKPQYLSQQIICQEEQCKGKRSKGF